MHSIPSISQTAFERGSAVVCILASSDSGPDSSHPAAVRHIESVLAHVDDSTPVLLAGTAAAIERVAKGLPPEFAERATRLVSDEDASATETVNEAMHVTAPADFVLVAPGVRVAKGWLQRLQGAARSDSTVASATPLSLVESPPAPLDHGEDGLRLARQRRSERPRAPAAAERQDVEYEQSASFDELARRVAEQAESLRPRIANIGPACAYIRRSALELEGALQETLTLDAAMADLALRMVAAGMVHVAADDVLIESSQSASHSQPASPSRSVQNTLVGDERGRLRRAMGIARTAVRRLSVTIDGRALTSVVGGTQTYIIELILALARDSRIGVRVLTPPDLSARASASLAAAEVDLLSYDDAVSGASRTDVVHRPQSIFTADDLSLLKLVGERIVIGQLDLIAYHNYTYHPDVDRWRAFRRTTRLALGGADQVVFFSQHARRDALAEDLLPEARAHVVGIGGDVLERAAATATAPAELTADEPFLLCIGADYEHKNRVFAIELLASLRELGWRGRLVFAGTHVPFGSSRERERELLRNRADLSAFTLDLGTVDEATRSWLYRHARALLYPTLYEGFGLLPLEAARLQLPCLFAAQASLSEAAGEAATLVAWNARDSAAAVVELLEDGPARDRHLARLGQLAIPSWDSVAEQLLDVYREALAAPPAEGAARIWQELDRESYITRLDRDVQGLKATAQEYQDAYHSLSRRVATGLPLIDDQGGLLSEAQQRGLMRVVTRKGLSGPLLGALRALGRRTGK